jgi:hypothetical protein
MSLLRNSPMTLVMLAIFVTMVVIATGYPTGASFMPFVVGIPAILLCLLQLVLDARAAQQKEEPRDTRNEFEIAQERVARMTGRDVTFEAAHMAPEIKVLENPTGVAHSREFIIWVYILALVAGILFFGYFVTVPLFILLFLRWEAGCSWLKAAVYAGVGSGALLLTFSYLLKFQLHPGFLTDRVLSVFG